MASRRKKVQKVVWIILSTLVILSMMLFTVGPSYF